MSLLPKGQRPRRSSSRSDSPLQRLRLQTGLTVPALAKKFAVSTATISRWLAGDRAAPRAFIVALQSAATSDVSEIAAAQRAYVERRKRRHRRPVLVLEVALPAGVDAERARERCQEAIAQAMVEESP